MPRSPCTSPAIQVQYWSSTGRSRCRWRRSAARLAGVADRPRIARAGSPGSAWVARNTTIDTSTRTSSPSSSRRTMKPDIPARNLVTAAPVRHGACSPRVRPRGSWSARSVSRRLAEPDGAEPVPEAVQVQRALARPEPLDLVGVAVDEVAEERDDVPADVVLELLHLLL